MPWKRRHLNWLATFTAPGLYLTGVAPLLRGLDKRLSAKTQLPVHVAEDPLSAVVRGTSKALSDTNRFRAILVPSSSVS